MACFLLSHGMSLYQPTFFDESERLQALTELNDPLEQLCRHIEFELFRKELEAVFSADGVASTGRKPYDVVLMFKILILQRLFNLSDQQLEYQITDRLSFTRFLGLHIGSRIPDYSTVWRFREALTKLGAVKRLFDHFTDELTRKGVLTKSGVIVDASIVEVPRQRNTRAENAQIKSGQTPTDWEAQPAKIAQKDLEARWTQKNGVNYYGYKDHVRADAQTVLITDYVVTAASTHDSQVLEELVGPEDAGQTLWADSAYKSAKIDAKLAEWKVENQIHEKGSRGGRLGEVQKKFNRLKSSIRCRIEHIFGHIENSMGGPELEYIGIGRIETGIGLGNLAYNLCRYVQLIRLGRVPASV